MFWPSGTSFDLTTSDDFSNSQNVVEVECLTKSGYVYTGSATMDVVEVNMQNITDLGDYGASDYLVLTDDLTIPAEYFALQTNVSQR